MPRLALTHRALQIVLLEPDTTSQNVWHGGPATESLGSDVSLAGGRESRGVRLHDPANHPTAERAGAGREREAARPPTAGDPVLGQARGATGERRGLPLVDHPSKGALPSDALQLVLRYILGPRREDGATEFAPPLSAE